jgi:type I site-specific restriction endonuclease
VGTLNKNSLIVFDRLDHGDHLYEYLTSELPDKQIFLIKGEVAQSERDKIIEIMEKNDNVICIAVSKIFSTGINIKNLHYIVFAQAGKAKVKTIQTIGRGVRMLLRKFEVVIFDIADNLHYGNKHLDKRRQVYDNEKMRHRTIEVKEG